MQPGKGLFKRREGYPGKQVTLALAQFLLMFIGQLQYLSARVILAGRLTFPLVNTSGRVNPAAQDNL